MEHTAVQKREESVQKLAENLQLYDGGRELIVNLGDSTRSRPKCKFCEQSFSSSKTLKIHLRDKHGDTSEMKEKQVNCLEPNCSFRCRVIDDLTRHLVSEHGREFTQEQYQFDNWPMFMKWKEATERDSRCTFIKMGGHQQHGGHFEKLYFYCSRTGFYRARGATSRRMKQQGTKKLNGYCTAKMIVYVTKLPDVQSDLQASSSASPARRGLSSRAASTGNAQHRIDVFFTREHYGHTFELKHLTLSKAERTVIVEMLKQRLTAEEILKELREATGTEEELERINLVTRKDISNIARQFNLPYVYSRGRTQSTGSDDEGAHEGDFGVSSASNEQQQLNSGPFYSDLDENGEMDGMRETHEQGVELAVSEVQIDEPNGRITLIQQVADADGEQSDEFNSTSFACTVTLLRNGDEPHACDGPQCAACDYACMHRYACDCFEYTSLHMLCVHTHYVHAYLNGHDRHQTPSLDAEAADLADTPQRGQLHAETPAGPSIIDEVNALVNGANEYADTDTEAEAPYAGTHYVDSTQYDNAYAYEAMKSEDDDAAGFYAEQASNNYTHQPDAAGVDYAPYETDAQAAVYTVPVNKVQAAATGEESDLIHCTSQLETAELRSQIVDRLESLRQAVSSSGSPETLNALLSRLSDVSGMLEIPEQPASRTPSRFSNQRTVHTRHPGGVSRNVSVLKGTRIAGRSNTRPNLTVSDVRVAAPTSSVQTSGARSSQPNIVAIAPGSATNSGSLTVLGTSAHIRKLVPTSGSASMTVRSQPRNNRNEDDDEEPASKITRVNPPNTTVITVNDTSLTRTSRQEVVAPNNTSKASMIIRVFNQRRGPPGSSSSSSVPDAALNVEVQ